MEVYRIHMGKAKCAVDLGDGSERGEYVDQDYILAKMGRPHRSISLMYCYYPLDEGWPGRASVVHASPDVSFAWDFPYDDYFTYKGGLGGSTEGEPFEYMREIRPPRTGRLPDADHRPPRVRRAPGCRSARICSPFGRSVPAHQPRGDGQLVLVQQALHLSGSGGFLCPCQPYHQGACAQRADHHLHRRHRGPRQGGDGKGSKSSHRPFPQRTSGRWTSTWHCTGAGPMTWQNTAALLTAAALWRTPTRKTKRSFERFRYLNGGVEKPMTMAEFNADGDVTGPYEQADMVKEFCDTLEREQADWFTCVHVLPVPRPRQTGTGDRGSQQCRCGNRSSRCWIPTRKSFSVTGSGPQITRRAGRGYSCR